ncbi:Metallo-beta-lactamase superfamily protein [Candidatus Tiddalikarchaeum anstoanum]|nr:Metallo-beta-lactamase superfamily protein [Candidatus Tiddalikarchaeum anstoanum]
MGVRSMCTFVQTDKHNILIDPGIALATRRLGLPPTNIELNTFNVFKNKILDFAKRSDIIIITHYHLDHYIPSNDEIFEDVYTDKIILCKNRKTKLNFNQRSEGKEFEMSVKRVCKEFHFIDGNSFEFDDVKIKFSEPLWHGVERSSFGYLIMATITSGKTKLLFAGDVMGPILKENADYIISENPDVLIMCGPPTHMVGYDIMEAHLELVKANLIQIIQKCKVKDIIYDHYILRDKDYMKFYSQFIALAKKKGKRFLTGAEYAGVPIHQLEAKRDQLYNEENNEMQ